MVAMRWKDNRVLGGPWGRKGEEERRETNLLGDEIT
jgi:hypothetical protein